jgi:hypothetical protein
MNTPADAFRRILAALDRLEIPYFVSGSVASSVYGIPRTTMDVDLVANLRVDQIDPLASELQTDFYADPQMMKDAFEHGRAFNVIHVGSSYKIDIFPLGRDAYSQEAFGRRRFAETKAAGGEPVECALSTAEDTILSKLRSYRAGGEISETQWNDLRGILMVSGAGLDRDYLRLWAPRLGVADLLDRLLSAAGTK